MSDNPVWSEAFERIMEIRDKERKQVNWLEEQHHKMLLAIHDKHTKAYEREKAELETQYSMKVMRIHERFRRLESEE